MVFLGPGYLAVTWLVHALARVRVIAILDNVVPHEGWPFGRLITRLGLGAMDGFIAQSKAVAAEFDGLLPGIRPERIRLVPHPTYEFSTAAPPDPATARRELGIRESRVLLFFGFIKAYKGLMVLLESVPHVRALLGEDFRLMVVGDFYEDEAPYRRRTELGIADRLTSSRRPERGRSTLLHCADLVVLPYTPATQSGIIQIAYHTIDRQTTRVAFARVRTKAIGYLVPPNDPRRSRAVADFIVRPIAPRWRGRSPPAAPTPPGARSSERSPSYSGPDLGQTARHAGH
jgi:glycosyltransferase involved in cell wall biosynthesis